MVTPYPRFCPYDILTAILRQAYGDTVRLVGRRWQAGLHERELRRSWPAHGQEGAQLLALPFDRGDPGRPLGVTPNACRALRHRCCFETAENLGDLIGQSLQVLVLGAGGGAIE